MKRGLVGLLFILFGSGLLGCNQPEERFGRTWYLDGAGNWGFGVSEMVYGLRKAGYKGQVSAFMWSMTMSPVADQVLKPLAGLGAARLAGNIEDYIRRFPNNEVNVVGLSAGAGVVLRAVEHIKPPNKINNMILLAASVSSEYDVRPVVKNMKGKIYVYYSSHDAMLAGPVRVLGAFGERKGEEPAGLVGLRCAEAGDRVVNIGWNPRFEKFGWSGSHTSCTSEAFVQYVLSDHILSQPVGTALAKADAKRFPTPSEPTAKTRTPKTSPPRTEPSQPEPIASAKRSVRQGPGGTVHRTDRESMRRPVPPAGRSERPGVAPPPGIIVYAPPPNPTLTAALKSQVERTGESSTLLVLSRRDPRFPSASQVGEGFNFRLVTVPGASSAQIELRSGAESAPAMHRLEVSTGMRCRNSGGQPYSVTLVGVDHSSQTVWLRIRSVDELPKRTAKEDDTPDDEAKPTT